ncbi:zf-TFIIB domain-containing protein [Simiduia litorea]|uniref:TFIIB-type zinc ribbon-containing protein n=1 Tax=Simiduia litorea TaxID=1435348 RepID=UPI0036F3D976
MKCPNCIERLAPTDSSGIQTYSCKYCSGVWVPERSIAALLVKEKKSITTQRLVFEANDVGVSKRKCPCCTNVALHTISVQDIDIDACKKCYGLFFNPDALKGLFPCSHKSQTGEESGVGEQIAVEGVFWLIIAFFTGSC